MRASNTTESLGGKLQRELEFFQESMNTLNEGSILEYPEFAKKNKAFATLFKMEDQTYDLRDQISKGLLALDRNLQMILKHVSTMKDSDFPDDPRSNEGKLGYTDRIKFKLKAIDQMLQLGAHNGLM